MVLKTLYIKLRLGDNNLVPERPDRAIHFRSTIQFAVERPRGNFLNCILFSARLTGRLTPSARCSWLG